MTRFVIDPEAALRLTRGGMAALPQQHRLLAPTLLRSQLLSRLYQAVRAGRMERREADAQLDRVRALRIRLLDAACTIRAGPGALGPRQAIDCHWQRAASGRLNGTRRGRCLRGGSVRASVPAS